MPTNLAYLVTQEREIIDLYSRLKREFARDQYTLDKLAEEFGTLQRAIEAAKEKKTLNEVAKRAKVSVDSIRRWSNGKLPRYFSQGKSREFDLEKITTMENFLFLLGFYQATSRSKPGDSFYVSSDDNQLKKSLKACFYSCFGSNTKKKGGSGRQYFGVHSRPLSALINNLTQDNTDVPSKLLITDEKKKKYFSGFLVNVGVCEEQGIGAHAGIIQSRGVLIQGVHEYLNEIDLYHHFYPSQHKIRFRGSFECSLLARFLPNCAAKKNLEKYLD